MTTTSNEGLPDLSRLFPVRLFKVTIRFTRKSSFPFLHHALVNGFVRNLTNPTDPETATPAHKEYVTLAPESGRIVYHAGDDYCFYIIAIAGIAPSINTLFEQLKQLPVSARKQGCTRQLSDNVNLIAIQDAISLVPVENADQATPLELKQFIDAAAQLQGRTANVNLMIGPLRMLREKENVRTKTAAKFCSKKSEFTGTLLFQRIYDSINNLCVELGSQRQTRSAYTENNPCLNNIPTRVFDAFWVDSYYQNDEKSAKENGGLFVHCELNTQAFTRDDFLLLLLGELLGIGQKRNFGYGRYSTGLMQLPNFIRHFDLAQALFFPQVECSPSPSLLTIEYSNNTNVRNTTPVINNETQRVITEFLNCSLHSLLSKVFLGYNASSRYKKKDFLSQLKALHAKGFRYSLTLDLSDFYPLIGVSTIINRLNLLYGTDHLWMQLESMLHNAAQNHGILLNSALRACFAKLMLDSFEGLITPRAHLVHLVNDFLILTQHQAEAETIRNNIEEYLSAHDFKLNLEKAVVRSVSDGIYFLELHKNT